MNLVVCIDDRGGMLFNNRRQSSDRYVAQRILELTTGSRLLVDSYTAKLFDTGAVVCDNLLESAQEQDYCFVENKDVASYVERAEKIIVFRWNRTYPADLHFPLDALSERKLFHSEEFSGYSHERIIMEIYSW